jgi:thiol-disulfide isomerase/thioredoxin
MARLLALLGSLLLLAACGGGSDGGRQGEGSATGSASEPGISLSGETLDGESLSLEDFRGKPVFVNVWASWWPSCNSEAVAYARFVESHPELEFVGLNISDDPGAARQFLDEYGWSWPSLSDPDTELAGALGLFGHPAIAVVDEDGVVVARHVGGGGDGTWEALAQEL